MALGVLRARDESKAAVVQSKTARYLHPRHRPHTPRLMRKTPRPPISDHRLARFETWARLWLIWLVGVCAAWCSGGERAHPRDLNPVARAIAAIVLLRARRCVGELRSARHRYGRLNYMRWRALAGTSLRCALRGRDWPERLMAIVAVMRDLDSHVAALRAGCAMASRACASSIPNAAPRPAIAPGATRIRCADSS